jgi:hypothetical protein
MKYATYNTATNEVTFTDTVIADEEVQFSVEREGSVVIVKALEWYDANGEFTLRISRLTEKEAVIIAAVASGMAEAAIDEVRGAA